MRLCRFGDDRLGVVEGSNVRDVTAALDVLPASRYPLPRYDVLMANLEKVVAKVKTMAKDAPSTPLEGKFSLEFCVAVAAVNGDSGLSQFTQRNIDNPDIRALASRVVMKADPNLPVHGTTACRMQVRLRDGTVLTSFVPRPKGSPENPLTRQELRQKFMDCAERRLPTPEAEQLFNRLTDISSASDVAAIAAMTHARRAAAVSRA